MKTKYNLINVRKIFLFNVFSCIIVGLIYLKNNPQTNYRMKTKFVYLLLLLCFLLKNSNLSAQNQNISISSIENSDKSIDLLYEKKNPGSYTLTLEFSNVKNCNVQTYEKVISESSGFIMKLHPLNKDQNIIYSMKYNVILGSINNKIDSQFHYILPFKNGKKIQVYEAEYAGQKYFDLEKPADWKSYSVFTNQPDTVCSMRKGIVVFIDNQYDDNSVLNAQYTSRRNKIVIEHEDGTFAMYSGLKKNGIFVKTGQTVCPQTELGIIEKFNNTEYRLDFNVYYLSKNIFDSQNKQSKNAYLYLAPVFYTNEGEGQIKSGKDYIVSSNENILAQ